MFMAPSFYIHHFHFVILSPIADTHFTIPLTAADWVDLGTAVRLCSPCTRLYIVGFCDKRRNYLTSQTDQLQLQY